MKQRGFIQTFMRILDDDRRKRHKTGDNFCGQVACRHDQRARLCVKRLHQMALARAHRTCEHDNGSRPVGPALEQLEGCAVGASHQKVVAAKGCFVRQDQGQLARSVRHIHTAYSSPGASLRPAPW